jgi:hypothetical protein
MAHATASFEGEEWTVQEHQSSFVVEASPAEVWSLWFGSIPTERSADPYVIEMDNVRIEIVHAGDALHEGLVRYCRYPIPHYVLSRGVAESWELVTDVVPEESYRYRAITKPPFAVVEGRQWLEAVGDGHTRVHFSERYEVANCLLRSLLERRLHRMISANNDRVIESGVRSGVQALRSAPT